MLLPSLRTAANHTTHACVCIISSHINAFDFSDLRHVLVPPTTEVDDNILPLSERFGELLHGIVDRMRCLKSRNDSLVLAKKVEA